MKTILSIQELSYGGNLHTSLILKKLSFDLFEGDFLMLLGHNGSGKTTLLKILSGESKGYVGDVALNGRPITNVSNVKILSQDPAKSTFSSLTILENCLLATGHRQSREKIRQHLHLFIPALVHKLDLQVGSLSGGERQVLALAMIFFDPPDLLLLDEHTSALDPKTAERVMEITTQWIKKESIPTIMTTHNIDFSHRFGNRIVAMRRGSIVFNAGAKEKEKLSKEEILKRGFNI